MAPFALFASALVVGFSGAIMPGPLLTAVIAESLRSGARGGVLAVLGHGVLELALVVALVRGLGRYLVLDPVLGALSLAGGAALVLLGYSMARGAGRAAAGMALPSGAASGAARSRGTDGGRRRLGPFITGALTSLSNPYWTVWWATVGVGYLALAATSGAVGVATFFVGHFSSDFIWYSLIALAVAGGRRFLGQGFYRGLIAACGVVLVGVGAYFVWSGGARLVG